MPIEIRLVPLLADNYAYLVHESARGETAVVDPSEAGPVLAAAEAAGWRISAILNTHHHPDHTGGNLALKTATGAPVIGPEADRHRIPGLDIGLVDGEHRAFGGTSFRALAVPGHTSGHIALHFAEDLSLFSGDTLFALGCGRLFEGTPAQMWTSLSRLAALPEATRVYCGHEYTASNCRFALSVEPGNPDLQERSMAIGAARAAGEPTIPSTIGLERLTNPFLRAGRPDIAAAIGQAGAQPEAVFAELRRLKDNF
jgi:hydroxyacylglutathione hydrolase